MGEDEKYFWKIYNGSDTTVCSSLQVIPIYLLGFLQTFCYFQKDYLHQFFVSKYLTIGNCIEHKQKPLLQQ